MGLYWLSLLGTVVGGRRGGLHYNHARAGISDAGALDTASDTNPDLNNPDYVDVLLDPFNPGSGGDPPLLAGRKGAIRSIEDGLRPLNRGNAPGRDIVLTGPRGNGKTVLLREFEQRAQALGIDVIVLNLTKIRDEATLAQRLLMDDDALSRAVEDSQCHPYFIQLWGKALCESLVDAGAAHVDDAVVDAAKPSVEQSRKRCCAGRYEEMQNQSLLPADSANKQINQLAKLGYIWRIPGSVKWEPGIPSLMTYVRNGQQGQPRPC